jgi:hypothetical protein
MQPKNSALEDTAFTEAEGGDADWRSIVYITTPLCDFLITAWCEVGFYRQLQKCNL